MADETMTRSVFRPGRCPDLDANGRRAFVTDLLRQASKKARKELQSLDLEVLAEDLGEAADRFRDAAKWDTPEKAEELEKRAGELYELCMLVENFRDALEQAELLWPEDR